MATATRITELLVALDNGNREALNELVPLVYNELRVIARKKLRYERSGHTLNSTALVHEAYLKLVEMDRVQLQSRAHFLAVAANAMRHILVDHARHRKRVKRGGGIPHVSLREVPDMAAREAGRILDLHVALEHLAALNPRHAAIVEYRFFGGMTIDETAAALHVSPATIKRDWNLLYGWLQRELERDP
jgi:RNA polymerase sigma factor (TIGR02999 family)